MRSNDPSTRDREPLDLARDVPTTVEDVRVLRQLRRQTPSWLSLTALELDAVLPFDALQRRPPTSPDRRPFTLDDEPPEPASSR